MTALLIGLALTLLAPTTAPATRPADASEIVALVTRTAGLDAWRDGKRLKFTFNVEQNGQQRAQVSHDWDLVTGVDTITHRDGRITSVNVYSFDPATATDDEKKDFRSWTNDSYWLLMPLKLGDPGVKFGAVTTTLDGPPSQATVTMSFGDGVGLTSGDQYDLSIDLERGVVDGWTFRPGPGKATTWAWTDYRDFNGLRLATNRPPENEGGSRIYFTDITFETK